MLHCSSGGGTSGMPHGLGLLTTVASLPPKYRSRYLNIKTKCEIPLDLSVKPLSPNTQIVSDVPIATNFTEVYTEPAVSTVSVEQQVNVVAVAKPMTPPLTPTPLAAAKRKHVEVECPETESQESKMPKTLDSESESKPEKICLMTPLKPIKQSESAPRTTKSQAPLVKATKNKATRKLKFDEETSSPVSGTIIRPLEDITDGAMQYSNGDIDPRYNIVEISEESKAELAAIKNVIGDYVCKLCRLKFEDAFGLARHRCACIVLLEYRCPECGKQFNCPANLASHRRWHKPKKEASSVAKKENRNTMNSAAGGESVTSKKCELKELAYTCNECGKKFKRQAYLRKHQTTHTNAKAKASGTQLRSKTQVSTTQETLLPVSATVVAIAGRAVDANAVSFQSYAGSMSSVSSVQSYNGTHEDEGVYTSAANGYDYDADSISECSSHSSGSSSAGYGRLQIVESGLTEEENIAAAALTNLRNCASVIKHTTLAH